jgi:enoyl-CoA hydratase/carnithine racemase
VNNSPPLAVEMQGAVAVLRLAAPPLNLLTQGLREAITAAAQALESDRDVRAVVLTGGTNFCAGADLKEFPHRRDPLVAERHCRNGHRMAMQIAGMTKPVVAAIEGACLGGGLELALACDFRVAAGDARLGLPEIGRGVWPGTGGLFLLERLVGHARTNDLAMHGRIFGGADDDARGIVDRCTAPGEAFETALSLAEALAARPTGSIATIKQLTDHTFLARFAAHLDVERDAYITCYQTEDAAEGWQAFLAKRPPVWSHA